MRTWCLLPCLILLSLTTLAAQSSSGQGMSNDNSGANGGPITVEGCVTSFNGYFSLLTRGGVFRLKGDHDSLLGHNGQQVRITGTVTPAGKKGSKALKIAELKKIADTCQE